MKKPLNGIRVLDLTNVLAGPYCCHQLVHLGAEVIKVEAPETGDLARQLGADERLNKKLMGISFLAQNAGKKSITLNLKSPRGKKLFLQLTETAEVLVENFRPGVMGRLGLGFEELKKINPNLIYSQVLFETSFLCPGGFGKLSKLWINFFMVCIFAFFNFS